MRFDIDPSTQPDIVGTLTDMSAVQSSSVDAVYSSHNIEHLFAHEVPAALSEIHRVLKPQGLLVITCPDLVSVCEAVAANKLMEPLYESPSGPISPIDILYGHRASIARGNHFMAHKCGFTYSALRASVLQAGFAQIYGGTRPRQYDLWMLALKEPVAENTMHQLAATFLP